MTARMAERMRRTAVPGWHGPTEATAWRRRLRRRRLPGGYLAFVLGAVAAIIAGPYAEGLWRCAATPKG